MRGATRRLREMVAGGALDEARALDAMDLDPGLPAMKALGVPHFLAAVRGEMAVEEAITVAQTATRHYAKRQLTWFRHQFPDWTGFEAQQAETLFDSVISFISNQRICFVILCIDRGVVQRLWCAPSGASRPGFRIV